MTYDEARRWLAKIGGSWAEAQVGTAPRMRCSIVVSVTSAKGQTVERHAPYDDTTQDWEREFEFRRAFVRACEELRRALD